MTMPLVWMFVALAVTLFIGTPVGLSIAISCMTFLLTNGYPPLDILVQRMVSGANSFTMLAMPLFVFAGSLMMYGSTPRLMKFANMLLRKVPGGLGAASMAACGFFGAVSGSGVASAAAIGSICGPEMIKQGYPKDLTAGLIAAGGTMACIIPPSIIMVVYASTASVSVGDMFLAGVVPGLLTIFALILLNCFMAVRREQKEKKPQMHYTNHEKVSIAADAILPMLMPVFVLFGVFSGFCTATEAAVVAVLYSFILAVFVYRELSFRDFFNAAADSVVTSAVIMLIISAATPFGWILSTQNVPQLFAGWLLGITHEKFLILAFFFLMLLCLGCFMETVCIIILVTPIILPIALSLGMNPVHFGVAMLMNLMVGSLTPPLSVNLFTSCRVLGMKYDEAFPRTLYVIAVVAVMAAVTMICPLLSSGVVNLFK
jgi:C4-dicarboxylate transporter, DctM subunit